MNKLKQKSKQIHVYSIIQNNNKNTTKKNTVSWELGYCFSLSSSFVSFKNKLSLLDGDVITKK